MSRVALAVAALVGLVLGALAVFALTGRGATGDQAIQRVVRAYILDHPEILPEAMDRLQARERARVIDDNRALIETPYAGASQGTAKPDVVLVEFFDYACGFCRASLPVVDRLLREDPKLRVVYREFPVLGPDSEAAATASLAAATAGRYAEYHRAVFAAGRPEPTVVAGVAARLGLDVRPTNAGRQQIATSFDLAKALHFNATPTWIVGDQLISGAVGYDALKRAIAEARSRR